MRRPVFFVSLCAAGALALVGCGGSQDDPSAAAASTSPGVDFNDEFASCLVGTWSLDMGFWQDDYERGMADPDISFSDVVFTATQTLVLDEDETFTAEIAVDMTMTATRSGQAIPMSLSGTGTGSGTWKVDDGELAMTVEDRDGEGTMTSPDQTFPLPMAWSLGDLLVLPNHLPVVCSGDTMTIDIEGLSDYVSGAPDELVATRQ